MCKCNVASAVNIFAAQEQHMAGLLQNITEVTGEADLTPLNEAYIEAYQMWARMRMCTYLV